MSQGVRVLWWTLRSGYRWAALGVWATVGCSGSVSSAGPDAAAGSSTAAAKASTKGGGASGAASGGDGSSPRASRVAQAGATGAASAAGDETARGGGSNAEPEPKQYPGHGFVVHEWGTDTIVVGSDGSLQRGLHHEEEDLPGFVYDRLSAAPLSPLSVTIKMETPITYFYSDTPLTVQATVAFPEGVLTQWYPAVSRFLPEIAGPGSVLANTVPPSPATYADPVLDPSFPFPTEMCRAKLSAIAGGKLDWGTLSVLPRDAEVGSQLMEAPLEKFGWSYAREVASNPIQTASGETERFLFYRGLGDFDLPVTVQSGAARHIALTNHYSERVGRVFVLNVGAERGAFTEHSAGIEPGATLDDVAPSLDAAPTLDDYEADLGRAVTDALDATGLYHDESTAMVNTWKRQWFRTPGVRVLYLIPQSWTDQSIPLLITPTPKELVRVMLIRVEVITPEQETDDVKAAKNFGVDSAQAKGYFRALGRFGEPRLRRALSLSPNSVGAAYLTELGSIDTAVASGE